MRSGHNNKKLLAFVLNKTKKTVLTVGLHVSGYLNRIKVTTQIDTLSKNPKKPQNPKIINCLFYMSV